MMKRALRAATLAAACFALAIQASAEESADGGRSVDSGIQRIDEVMAAEAEASRGGGVVAAGPRAGSNVGLEWTGPAGAAGDGPAGATESDETHAAEHSSDHGSHPHHVSVLLGAARNGAIDESAFAVGAGYRYALNDRFSIGPSVDFASYDHEETMLVLAALYWKPAGGLVLMAGPGVELVDYKGSAHGSSHDIHAAASASEGGAEDESKFAFRMAAGWELHAGRISIMPLVAADLIDGETTMVFAVDVGFGF